MDTSGVYYGYFEKPSRQWSFWGTQLQLEKEGAVEIQGHNFIGNEESGVGED